MIKKAGQLGPLVLLITLAFLSVSAQRAMADVLLVADGQSRASIVIGPDAGEFTRRASTELQEYIGKLTGVRLPIATNVNADDRPAGESLIVLGTANENLLVRELARAGLAVPGILKKEGFVLQTVAVSGHRAALIAGKDDAGTLYGAYELLERLGITFRLTGDIVPARTNWLAVPELNVRKEPAFARRGFLHTTAFDNLTMFDWPDYEQLLNQMCRMKCNYLQFWWFPYTPWLQFSYRGESKALGDVSAKESGYHMFTLGGFGSRTIADVSIGREHFTNRARMAPVAMQHIDTPEEAFELSRKLLKQFLALAARRNIKVWLAVEMGELPPNLARFSDIVGDTPFNYLAGSYVHPLDPVNREIQVSRLRALHDTYPEAEGVFLNFAENYQDLAYGKYYDFFQAHRAAFQDIRTLYLPWSGTLGNFYEINADRVIDSNIAYFDLFTYLLKKRDELLPGMKVGLMTVGRGYALPLFNKMLPADVPFASLESSGVWTPGGMPMSYFGGMGERERIMQPRIDDDFEMFAMQFNVRQFVERDHIFADGLKNGLSGFAGQLDRPRGTEFNSSFLAEATWEPELTAQQYYQRSAERIFGKAAAPEMTQALLKLEENQLFLDYYAYEGGYGILLCCSGIREVNAVYKYYCQKNPYAGPVVTAWQHLIDQAPAFIAKREGSIRLLDEALLHLKTASPAVLPQARHELEYMINRTQTYQDLFTALNMYRRGIVNFDSAFRHRNEMSQEQFVAQLESSVATMRDAFAQLKTSTENFSRIVDHVSDLAVLYHLNARVVLGTDLSIQFLQNVVNYHRGKPFMAPVDFERLFPRRPDKGIEK